MISVLAPFIVVAILVGTYLIGETAKRGGVSEDVIDDVVNCSSMECVLWGMERSSSTYYSFLKALHENLFRVDLESFSHLFIPLKTLLYRLDAITGGNLLISKPDIASINRFNYESIALITKEREGTSPGFVASFLLCFPFPLNIILLLIYSAVFIRFMNVLVVGMEVIPNLGGLALISWIMMTFLESPIDLLVLIDDASIFAAAIFLLFLMLRKQSSEMINSKNVVIQS